MMKHVVFREECMAKPLHRLEIDWQTLRCEYLLVYLGFAIGYSLALPCLPVSSLTRCTTLEVTVL